MLRLMSVPSLGPVRINRLLAAFGDPSSAVSADYHSLQETGGLSGQALIWLAGRQWDERAIDRQLDAIQATGTVVIFRDEEYYPVYLNQIYDPPPVLFLRGQVPCLNDPCFAVVGTREPSRNGEITARDLAAGIAAAGYIVVSGMARGIDSAAHEAALAAGGRTVAVLGSGVDVIYPGENGQLAEKIMEQGCLVSEFPMGSPPESHNFPRRNRIISGLSRGVLVVEAGQKSGALITANYALNQNRDVFAVPGDPRRPSCRGTNSLIREGAKLVQRVEDILEELGTVAPAGSRSAAIEDKPPAPALSREERIVFEGLSEEALHVDEIADRLGMEVSRLLGILLRLSMKRLVREYPGKLFSLF